MPGTVTNFLAHATLILFLPPLMLGVITKTKAAFAGRVGAPLLQPYYDLIKLFQKGSVFSRTTTWVFRAGPVVGVATALLLRRPDVPARRLLQVLVLAPLVVPQFVLGYSWTQAYSQAGFTDQLLGLHWAGLTGPVGVVVVLVVDAAPLSYLLTTAGLATRAQPDLERAARASGCTAVRLPES